MCAMEVSRAQVFLPPLPSTQVFVVVVETGQARCEELFGWNNDFQFTYPGPLATD